LFFGVTGVATAGQLEDAAHEAGDYSKALSLLRPLAEKDDAEAMDRVGSIYSGGRGVPKNKAEGLKWFLRAANSGNAHAMQAIGAYYEYGEQAGAPLPQDHAEAVRWSLKAMKLYRSAADKGDAVAQRHVADMFFSGVMEDHSQAVKWYRKAADQGDAYAQASLGLLYRWKRNDAEAAKWYRMAAEQGVAAVYDQLGELYANGRGVRQDYVQAHKWFNLAAASYPPTEIESRVKALKNRELVAHKMTPPQLAEAQRLATEWKPKLSLH
jgi:uncharacterized protein